MKKKILIVASKVNEEISLSLTEDVIRLLKTHEDVDHEVLQVPGAFEIPAAIIFSLSGSVTYDAYIACGCILRGGTSHADIIAENVTYCISKIIMKYKVPIASAIIHAEHIQISRERVGINSNHSYAENAVNAAIGMIKIKQHFTGA